MQAIILAAGMGKRLKDLTKDATKCMVKVNGITLIERMLSQLDAFNMQRIILVVGYKAEALLEYIGNLNVKTPIEYVQNRDYSTTNNIYSLYLARKHLLEDDTLLLESDLIFEDAVLKQLTEYPYPSLALVAKYESWMDGTVVKIDKNNKIKEFITKKDFEFIDIPNYFKTVNMYKFSKSFSQTHYVPFLEAYQNALGKNEYYEQVLKVIIHLEHPEIIALPLTGEQWYEIDDIQDLDIAESIFTDSPDLRLDAISNRYGGYWRYPSMIDFCYLVNPFFPTLRMLDEIKANFQRLVVSYPSGVKVNSLLAAKSFGVKQQHIVIGNGAAELIKSLMSLLEGNIGIIYPTFDEYPNRLPKNKIVAFTSENDDFAYTVNEIINYFSNKDIGSLLIINPDNPTGNYICRNDMMKLIEWSEVKKIKIIIDESFVDFADEYPNTLIEESIIEKYKNLIVIKSISKSYGVPGLRLGVLASCDESVILMLKKDIAIWNINSFAEFYMQIEEKYKDDYKNSLILIRKAREIFLLGLKEITNLRIIPSQANYFTVEIVKGLSAKELTTRLLTDYNILLKDLSSKESFKNRQFIRLAIKNEEENNKLLQAFREIF